MAQPQFYLDHAAASLAEGNYLAVIRQARMAYDDLRTVIPPEARRALWDALELGHVSALEELQSAHSRSDGSAISWFGVLRGVYTDMGLSVVVDGVFPYETALTRMAEEKALLGATQAPQQVSDLEDALSAL